MGVLGGVFLVLVLRGAALAAGQAGCPGGARCEVTWVLGNLARVQCGEQLYHQTQRPTNNGSYIEKKTQVDAENFLESSNSTREDFDLYNEQRNATLPNGSDVINRSASDVISVRDNTNDFDTDLNDSSRYVELTLGLNLANITKLELFLLNNFTMLDLSLFPNVRTVILNSSGHIFSEICGSQNITDVAVTSVKLRDVSFVKYFLSARKLNLSYNLIESFPGKELPLTLLTLDLSYNNIIFDRNISLPDSLHLLNVSFNNITSIKPVFLKGNVIVLDLSNNRLELFPFLNTSNLEELYLSNNKIPVLSDKDLNSLSTLTVLDISNNRLRSLEERVFQGLSKLQRLDLSTNSIVTLAPATFQFLNNLIVLRLSGNINLGSLQDAEDASFLFGTGQRLQIIDASLTNLTRLPSTLTRSVRKLLLSDNTIHTIQCGELDSFPLLKEMDLSNNHITEIEEDALGRLDFLVHLKLSENNLTSIPKSLPDQLEVLDLRCNVIKTLNNVEFLGMQSLRVLLLSRNRISVVEDGAFGQLIALEVLDLSQNPIKTLSRTSLIGPRKLKEIYLASLTDLVPLQEPLSFPAPESAHLEVLNIASSPVLATQLMDDVAALTMFHELFELNLSHCELLTLRSDLPKYLPRLHRLELAGNHLNCSNIIWLVKWLQAINITMQDKGKLRTEIYHFSDISCGKVNKEEHQEESLVMCAIPVSLYGKQIISLKEEDFPDLKLMRPTHPPPGQVIVTKPYLPTEFGSIQNTTLSGWIDTLMDTTLSINNLTKSTLVEPSLSQHHNTDKSRRNHYKTEPESTTKPFMGNSYNLEKPPTKTSKSKFGKSINRSAQKWKYLKSETKYKPSVSTLDPAFVLLNDTQIVRDIDNHLNASDRSRAQLLAHEPPPTSHPGMVVFLLIVGVILGASSAMVYSQCSQARRSRDYQHHQDIEVSSFGGTDLW